MEKILNRGTTFVSLLLATLVMWAKPLGVDFDQTDATVLTTHLNEIAAQILILVTAVSKGIAEVKERL